MGSKKREKLHFDRQSYFRLIKYAFRYKLRLAVGLIAGFLVGASLLGSLMMIPQLLKGVNIQDPKSNEIQKKNLIKIVEAVETSQTLTEEEKVKKIDRLVYPGKYENRIKKEIIKIHDFFAKFGINLPIRYEKGNLVWQSGDQPTFSFPAEDEFGKMTWQFFTIFVLGFVGLWALKNLATFVNRYYTRWVGTKVVADLRNEVFAKLMDQSLKFYGKIEIGQLIARCTNDTASIESAVANVIADATRCPLEILACISAIIIASYQSKNFALPIILFIGLPICILPVVLLGRRIRKVYRSAYQKIANVVSRMHEVFTGIKIIKAYHTERIETQRFKEVNRSYVRTVINALKTELLMAPLMETVAVSSTLVFLVYSYSQKVSIAELAQLLAPAFLAYQPIKKLAKVTTYIQRSMAAADRFFNLLDTDTAIKERENAVDLPGFNDKISFENVSFAYDEKNILNNVNFDIPKGHVVAVVGETGSGKTTIANLIARFYDVTVGKVTIDGHDVRDLKIASLRDHIGIVSQESILFNESIADNISYGCENKTMAEIEEAAKQANAHEFIVGGKHADGYDTIVGDKGFKLSGGEKQRVCIARAILKNPPILILDEATSALDTVTERLVQDALNRIMTNRTVFAIAHRLSTIKHANAILVLKAGEIAEFGTHDELLAKDGLYAHLYNTQFDIK